MPSGAVRHESVCGCVKMAHVTQWKSSVLKNTKKCTRTPRTVEKPFESRQDTGLRPPSGTHSGADQGPSASLDDCLLSSENCPSTSVITRIPPQPCACVTDGKTCEAACRRRSHRQSNATRRRAHIGGHVAQSILARPPKQSEDTREIRDDAKKREGDL